MNLHPYCIKVELWDLQNIDPLATRLDWWDIPRSKIIKLNVSYLDKLVLYFSSWSRLAVLVSGRMYVQCYQTTQWTVFHFQQQFIRIPIASYAWQHLICQKNLATTRNLEIVKYFFTILICISLMTNQAEIFFTHF